MDNWVIRITEENRQHLIDWVQKQPDFDKQFSNSSLSFLIGEFVLNNTKDKSYQYWGDKSPIGYTEIDFETFKEITGMGEEKPKQLLGEKEVVHCPTLELAEKVIEIFLNFKVENCLKEDVSFWHIDGERTCFDSTKTFGFSDIEWYRVSGYTIIPAEQFIKDNEQKIFTIEDVRNGKCAIENDGTVEELNKVLKCCFHDDPVICGGTHEKYYANPNSIGFWSVYYETDLPTQSVKLFLSQIEEKEHPADEWQPKAENEFSPKWGEPVEVTLFGKKENVIYVSRHPTKNNKHICVRGEGLLIIRNKNLRQLSIHEFTTEQAKLDLAKLHNLNPEQIKIV